MNTGILHSVGRHGINATADVKFIQTALNTYARKYASSSFPLKVDGICGDKTIQAIYNFQRNHVGIINPVARIDPHGRTLRHLTSIAPHTIATAQTINSVAIGFMLTETY